MDIARYGIVGHPVKHSLSPAMQLAAFNRLGIEAEYERYDIAPEGLDAFLSSLARKGIRGINVTIPHKIKAKEYLERHGSLDANAQRLGAVNTIKVTGDGLCGYNTDGPGFYRSLVEDLGFEPEGKNLFILGAGGAATAIIMYLGNGPKSISVYDVDGAKTGELKKYYENYFDDTRLDIVTDRAGMRKALSVSDLLVNTTPIGMRESDPSPVDKDLLHSGLRVYDIVYNRRYTRLVREANSLKLHAVTGLGMLLYQGVIAFEVWTGEKAPVAVMKSALREALETCSKGA